MTAHSIKAPKTSWLERLIKYVCSNATFYVLLSPALIYSFVYCYMTLPFIYIAITKYSFMDGIFGSPFIGL